MGAHAEEGTGGGWASGCGVEGVVEVGDLGNVSVPVLTAHMKRRTRRWITYICLQR